MIVTVAELKASLRIDHDADDALLERLLTQAQAAAEDYCRVDFEGEGVEAPPEAARLAVQLMAGFLYEHPDMDDSGAYRTARAAFQSLLYPHRDESKMF